mgnify:CR=1 FL=1
MLEGNESEVVLELKRRIKLLEETKGENGNNDEKINKMAYDNLMKTNERLMQEIIRLNAKHASDNSVYESMLSESSYIN